MKPSGASFSKARPQGTKVTVDLRSKISKIDDRIYGSFIEHLGRAVYEGIYQPGHPVSDEEGWRRDVLELVKELNVPVVRYPGGNFVSNFFWEDSVGPREQRRKRLDLAWRTLEPNEVGINEFTRWARKAGSSVMLAVNLGTRGLSDALNLLEYCNLNTDSYYASLRRSHGDDKPYGIKLWCMGNEMDGPWQVGHKTAEEYGRLAAETAKAMKMMDDSIECVVCGSAHVNMPTFGQWEKTVLEESYEYIDYISLHQYFSNKAGDTDDFFASVDDLDTFINTVAEICDEVKEKKGSSKTVNLSFDEWNCWYHVTDQDDEKMKREPWGTTPHLLEDNYTYEDAIVNGLALIKFMKHSDRVKIACLAQLVNVIAPIMTEKEGSAWRQTIFYPFLHASRYGRGTALDINVQTGTHNTSNHSDVTDIEAVAVISDDERQLTVFAVNRTRISEINFEADLKALDGFKLTTWQALESLDMTAVNKEGCEMVRPVTKDSFTFEGGILKTSLQPASWNVFVFNKD